MSKINPHLAERRKKERAEINEIGKNSKTTEKTKPKAGFLERSIN